MVTMPNKSLKIVCFASMIAVAGLLVPAAEADDLQLNFAAVNQSPWTPGGATIFDNKFLLPDPALSGHLDLGDFNVDPGSAALNFLGSLLGINLKGLASVTFSPTGDFTADLSASYHINAGTLNLNYPENVQLNLPREIDAGKPFQVSASLPSPLNQKLQVNPAQFVGAGGLGYSGLSNVLNYSTATFTPDRGFQTTFPYADAQLGIDLKANAGVRAEACFLFFCDHGTIDLGGVDYSANLIDVNSLTGISVLGQTVLGYGTHNFDNTLSLTVHPPDLSIAGKEKPDQTLAGSGNETIVHASFDAASLIPVVGPFLAGSVGPIDYTLLSVSPGVGLGLYQDFSFTPNLMVNLDFSSPVREADGTVTSHVMFPVDGTPVTLTPATIGGFGANTIKISPTFILDNQFHNTTGLTISGDVDVAALQLGGLFDAGPAFHEDPVVAQIPIPLFSDTFQVAIPPITTAADVIPRTNDFQLLFTANVSGVLDDLGRGTFDLSSGNQLLAEGVTGQEVQIPVGPFNSCPVVDFQVCDTVLVLDQDVYDQQQNNLGKVFCISCIDGSRFFPQTNPVLTAGDGSSLFLSDLSTFPSAPTPDDIQSSDSIFAGNNFFQNVTITPPTSLPSSVPEPATVFLLGSSLFGLAAFRWRRLKG